MSSVKIIFGAANVQSTRGFTSPELLSPVLDVIEAANITTIDTAELYGDSQAFLGAVSAGKRFTIDTKAPGGFQEGTLSSKSLVTSAKTSLKTLGVDQVDVFYIHAPDNSVSLDDWLPGIHDVHQSGAFRRFGLSNFKADDVQKVYDYCKAHGYVLPSVYQGNYSAVARLIETSLFPLLRKLEISFYAYSPIAGGFLLKSKQDLATPGKGRFDPTTPVGQLYNSLYGKPAYIEALEKWEAIANEAGCAKGEMAYRWVAYNSTLKKELGDAVIVGASKLEQLEQTLNWLKKGPLDEKTSKAIDDVWKTIEHEAPLDNYHS